MTKSKGIRKHPRAKTSEEHWRYRVRVNEDGCWTWIGSITAAGYGRFPLSKADGGGHMLAHRFAYQLYVGDLDPALVLDHLCRNRSCVNPKHLEQVISEENIRRGRSERWQVEHALTKTHCKRGHLFDEVNTYWHGRFRYCRACNLAGYHRRRAEREAARDQTKPGAHVGTT